MSNHECQLWNTSFSLGLEISTMKCPSSSSCFARFDLASVEVSACLFRTKSSVSLSTVERRSAFQDVPAKLFRNRLSRSTLRPQQNTAWLTASCSRKHKNLKKTPARKTKKTVQNKKKRVWKTGRPHVCGGGGRDPRGQNPPPRRAVPLARHVFKQK